jgi:hypothetical protein
MGGLRGEGALNKILKVSQGKAFLLICAKWSFS